MSDMTNSILRNVAAKLSAYVLYGPATAEVRNDQFAAHLRRMKDLLQLQYDAWQASYKLESTDQRFAYRNLPEEIQELDAKVKWQFQLLTCWLNHEKD